MLDNKWQGTVSSRIADEVDALTFALVDRIQALGERYAETVEEIESGLATLEAKVASHLADMGVK